jgi:hypothetical protein
MVEQQVQFRYDPDDDALELLVIYRGVAASDETERTLQNAVEDVEKVLEGGRILMITPWGIGADLDDLQTKILNGEKEVASPHTESEVLALIDTVTLEDVGTFYDREKRFSVYQLFLITDMERWIDYVNGTLSRAVLAKFEKGTFLSEFPLFDERTAALWQERAKGGWTWIAIVNDGLELDFPMTRESFDRVRTSVIREMLKTGSVKSLTLLAQFVACLDTLKFSGEHVFVRFVAPVGGVFPFVQKWPEAEYRSGLLGALIERGWEIDASLTAENVEQLLVE